MTPDDWGYQKDNRDWRNDFKDVIDIKDRISRDDVRDRFRRGFTKRRLIIIGIVLGVLVLIGLLSWFARVYTDVLWYNHVGYQQVFWTTWLTKIFLVLIFGAAFFILLYGNIRIARRLAPKEPLDVEGSPIEEQVRKYRSTFSRLISWGLLLFSLIAAFFAGLSWTGKWDVVLMFLNRSSFGAKDPIFSKDVGFYLFSYPFQRALVDWLIGAALFIFFICVLIHLLDGGIRLKWGKDMLAPHVKAHLSVILAVFFLLKAWSYRLNMYELLWSKRGAVAGASYTDVNAQMPALWAMIIITIICAVALLANIWRKGWLLPAGAIAVLVLATIIAGWVYPAIIQNWRVKPNEFKAEEKYLDYAIDFTRKAYDVEDMKTTAFRPELTLDLQRIDQNQATVNNIRLWDPRPLLETYEQLQSIRQYYDFKDVDVDRYTLNGDYRQMMISAREMNQEALTEKARTWVNQHLVYTHGYGVCMSPSNDVLENGNPDLVVKDIPPVTDTNIKITRPEIYYGEKPSEEYVVVNSDQKEFDYPKGDENVYTSYEGSGGVKTNSFWRKTLFAIRFADVNTFFSGQITDQSRFMYYRDISERVNKCAPFLKMDNDPYVVTDGGKLYWIVDCYTYSDLFPYSEKTGDLNYIRNSVKAVVDAYEGDVTLYVVDEQDPVLKTYRKIFPDIFTDLDEIPAGLKAHLRYPEDLFKYQANILRTYHMTDPQVFYGREDEWDIPMELYYAEQQEIEPYYVIMALPGEDKEEMFLMIPFTPHEKKNMIAWLAARCDYPDYGEMGAYLFPKEELVYGPIQVESRIDQDPNISRQFSLWGQRGSNIIRGNLLVIPIDQSLLYVEPVYLQAEGVPIPELKRVIVVYGPQVAMEETLAESLDVIFGGAPPPEEELPPPEEEPVEEIQTVQDLIQQAQDTYDRAEELLREGDFAGYGEQWSQLKDILQELAETSGQ